MSCWIHWLESVLSLPWLRLWGRVGYGIELVDRYLQLYEQTALSAESFISHVGRDAELRNNFRKTIIELRLLKFAKLLAREVAQVGLPISWVRVDESNSTPRLGHQVISVGFDLVMGDDFDRESVLNVASAAAARAPLSKFGIDAKISASPLTEAEIDGYWYSSGQFWKVPVCKPSASGEPHVVGPVQTRTRSCRRHALRLVNPMENLGGGP